MNNPCRYCDKRHLKCHAECEEYKQFYDECRRRNRERWHENDIKNYEFEAMYKRKKFYEKKRGKKKRGRGEI